MSKIISIEVGENGASVRLEGKLKFFEMNSKTAASASCFIADMMQFVAANIIDPSEVTDDKVPCNEIDITVYAFFRARPPEVGPAPEITAPANRDDLDFCDVGF